MKIRPISLTITTGTSLVIVIPPQFLKPGKFFDLEFVLSQPDFVNFRDLVQGTEIVSIANGVGGTEYVLETCTGDIFYADRLRLCFCYRLRWSNNGPVSNTAGLLAHFINLNTPCCARAFNPANTAIPPATPATPA
jgi:hypothetical protein